MTGFEESEVLGYGPGRWDVNGTWDYLPVGDETEFAELYAISRMHL